LTNKFVDSEFMECYPNTPLRHLPAASRRHFFLGACIGSWKEVVAKFEQRREEIGMPRMQGPANGQGSEFRKIMSMRPEIAKSWNALDEVMRFTGVLDPALKEEVRKNVAQVSGCLFCASLGDPQGHYDDPRWAAAAAYSRSMAADPKNVSDLEWAQIEQLFSTEEIVELNAWIAFMYASEMVGAVLKLDPATPALKDMYVNWIRNGISKAQRAAAS
jgi:alkylhydroperoxidase family enzyme